MKKFLQKSITIIIILALAQASFASTPNTLNYQGKILNNQGVAISTAINIRFSFWSSADWTTSETNPDGSINTTAANYGDWQEVQDLTPNSNGIFSAELGSVSSIPTLDYSKHRYLQVEVKNDGDPDTAYQLMDPSDDEGADTLDRKRISSTPYAQISELAASSNQESFIIDKDNTIETAGTGEIKLQFGNTLSKYLSYDYDNNYFNFNDNVNIQGNLTLTGTINGVDINNLSFDSLNTRSKTLNLTQNQLTVETDGSNNLANIYLDSESSINPHDYYIIKTSQSALQDLTLKFKVKLPADFVDFSNSNDLSFFYKNTGTDNSDSKVNITIQDEDGDQASSANDLFNNNWTEYLTEFDGVDFDPQSGEYIYLTIQGYASNDSGFDSPYIGELILIYTGR